MLHIIIFILLPVTLQYNLVAQYTSTQSSCGRSCHWSTCCSKLINNRISMQASSHRFSGTWTVSVHLNGLFSPLLRYVNRKRTPPWPLLTASRVRAPWSYNPMVSFHLFLLFYTPIRVILHTHLVAAVNVAVLRRIGISARSPQTSELYRNIDSMILWSDCEHE